ncbi:thioredoxin family protein [Cellulomonas sp. IC4_254]|uniref:thioredoxin family protein n=1 Tax=Cellulomonas sp. IC4_254 TaxID=2714040 RepID=UPI0014226341|nr:thioredoxin family protein [Cellulomonas sp. IC4_254]NHT18072.1 thioredoxin family protein [Cellulomonas sp. IC4_254]
MGLRVLIVLGVLAVAVVAGLVWRSRNGRFVASRGDQAAAERLTPADLGAPLGAAATFLQLSSEACAPCRSTAAVLGALAADRPGVAHVEVAAEERLDLVRRFDVLRTPTVLVLDGAGAVRGRLSGATTRQQALDALDRCPATAA